MHFVTRPRDMPIDPTNCAITLDLRFFSVISKAMRNRQPRTPGTTPSRTIRKKATIGVSVTKYDCKSRRAANELITSHVGRCSLPQPHAEAEHSVKVICFYRQSERSTKPGECKPATAEF